MSQHTSRDPWDLAEALFDGRGVARDPAGSRRWLEKAARQGWRHCQKMLSRSPTVPSALSRYFSQKFGLPCLTLGGLNNVVWRQFRLVRVEPLLNGKSRKFSV